MTRYPIDPTTPTTARVTVKDVYDAIAYWVVSNGGRMKSKSLRHIGGRHYVTSYYSARNMVRSVDAYNNGIDGWSY